MGREWKGKKGGLIEIDLHHIPKCLSCLVYLSNCLLSALLFVTLFIFVCYLVRLHLRLVLSFCWGLRKFVFLFLLGGGLGRERKDGRKDGKDGKDGREWEGWEWEWDTLDWHPLAHSMLLLFFTYF